MRKPAGGWNMPSSAAGHASGPRAVRSRAARSTRACAEASTSTSCTSNIDLLGPAACKQIGGDQGGIVPALLPNAGDQSVGGRIGQLVEPALQRGGGRLGIEPGGADALVAIHSSVTYPRSSNGAAPIASNSSRHQPTPMPSVSRPFDRKSLV